MKNLSKYLPLMTVTLCLAASTLACSIGKGRNETPSSPPSSLPPTAEESLPTEESSQVDDAEISLLTPYLNESDIQPIKQAFSANTSAPWKFVHLGIDFTPKGDLKPFQAVCSGTVDLVELWQLDTTLNWQVSLRILCNSTYSVIYAFEPMTADRADGETQLQNIIVSEGQSVARGDIIGYLAVIGEGSHVDFGFLENWERICPEPFFSPEAKESILSLLHISFPGASLCY
ncbi:MAG: M23 family metallopeptidase [Anaerolineales bacterium]